MADRPNWYYEHTPICKCATCSAGVTKPGTILSKHKKTIHPSVSTSLPDWILNLKKK